MATKYSPGPWVAVPNDNERGGDGKWLVCNARKPGEPADQWGVCTVWHQSGGEINGHEDEANAKLIAAAPEMAEALRKIAFEPFGAAEASDRQVLDAITELARAALAKAAL